MGKILNFTEDSDTPIGLLKTGIRLAEDGIKENNPPINCTIAMQLQSGEWVTGRVNTGFAKQAEAIAHLQVDMMDGVVRANYIEE